MGTGIVMLKATLNMQEFLFRQVDYRRHDLRNALEKS